MKHEDVCVCVCVCVCVTLSGCVCVRERETARGASERIEKGNLETVLIPSSIILSLSIQTHADSSSCAPT